MSATSAAVGAAPATARSARPARTCSSSTASAGPGWRAHGASAATPRAASTTREHLRTGAAQRTTPPAQRPQPLVERLGQPSLRDASPPAAGSAERVGTTVRRRDPDGPGPRTTSPTAAVSRVTAATTGVAAATARTSAGTTTTVRSRPDQRLLGGGVERDAGRRRRPGRGPADRRPRPPASTRPAPAPPHPAPTTAPTSRSHRRQQVAQRRRTHPARRRREVGPAQPLDVLAAHEPGRARRPTGRRRPAGCGRRRPPPPSPAPPRTPTRPHRRTRRPRTRPAPRPGRRCTRPSRSASRSRSAGSVADLLGTGAHAHARQTCGSPSGPSSSTPSRRGSCRSPTPRRSRRRRAPAVPGAPRPAHVGDRPAGRRPRRARRRSPPPAAAARRAAPGRRSPAAAGAVPPGSPCPSRACRQPGRPGRRLAAAPARACGRHRRGPSRPVDGARPRLGSRDGQHRRPAQAAVGQRPSSTWTRRSSPGRARSHSAAPFFEGGLITRRSALRSAYAQFVFGRSGADHDQMERMRAYLSQLSAGWPVQTPCARSSPRPCTRSSTRWSTTRRSA